MAAGLRRVIRASVALFFIGLAIPAVALAGNGGKCTASACKVYVEPSSPTAGNGKQQPPHQPQHPSHSSGGTKKHLPGKLSRVLAHAGKDSGPLHQLLLGAGPGSLENGNGSGGSPSLLSSVFGLGAGPLVLIGLVLATALALATRGRGWLRRPPSA